MSELINPVGPEANNRRAREFEDQIIRFAASLGWDARCRNVDLYHTTGEQSSGVDVLLAFDDPQLGLREGIIGEAKIRHPLRPGVARDEVVVLARKLAKLGPIVGKLDVAQDLVVTRTGLLVYDAAPYDPARHAEGLSAIQQDGLSRAHWPREVLVLAPDALVGLADCLDTTAGIQFFWPPFDQRQGEWASCAPPHQVAAGMLAFRSGETVTLWLRDEFDHDEDFAALSTVAWEWRLNIDRIVCSNVRQDRYMAVVDRWRKQAEQAARRDVGKLPDAIQARGLSFGSLTAFTDRWGVAA
jgi:hypothetical protein